MDDGNGSVSDCFDGPESMSCCVRWISTHVCEDWGCVLGERECVCFLRKEMLVQALMGVHLNSFKFWLIAVQLK